MYVYVKPFLQNCCQLSQCCQFSDLKDYLIEVSAGYDNGGKWFMERQQKASFVGVPQNSRIMV